MIHFSNSLLDISAQSPFSPALGVCAPASLAPHPFFQTNTFYLKPADWEPQTLTWGVDPKLLTFVYQVLENEKKLSTEVQLVLVSGINVIKEGKKTHQAGFIMLKVTARQMALQGKEARQRRVGDKSAESTRSEATKTSVS